MKALTVYAPYAALIASGDKKIECRSWPTNYRGPLLICSAAFCPPEWRGLFISGQAIAVSELVDCRPFRQCPEDYDAACIAPEDHFEGFAWILSSPRTIEPAPVKGRQRIFNIDFLPKYVPDVAGDDLLAYWHSLGLIDNPEI